MSTPEWLARAARRSQTEPGMMGYVFEQYRHLEGRSEEGLAKELGCSRDALHRMALCRCPEESRFEEQATAIATRFGVELLPLLNVLRRVEVMVDATATAAEQSPSKSDTLTGTSMRVAARDRTKGDETAS